MIDAIAIVPLTDVPPAEVETLLDRAFGNDRHQRTAYRVREGLEPIASLSFAALDGDSRLLGSIQCWPVALTCDDGGSVPMVMVGPVAVEPEIQRGGLGRALTSHMLEAASNETLMLVGDPEYYARFFGFSAERTAKWRLPGPFEPRRLLARGDGVPDCAGELGPRRQGV